MDKQDFSEYEKRRAEQHEKLCRATALLMCLDHRICHLRACYRKRMCSGPMRPSPHQAGAVRAQREIGLSGKACAELPFCVANMAAQLFGRYSKLRSDLQQVAIDVPELDLLQACREVAAKPPLKRRPLDFFPRSSDFKR
ncbi:hypothetical protein EDE05_10723 [Neorhizobium sp. R1-B]|uniref:hypothetical protein n=1 Tax=unclassified Neorhizobium TaxID=2629175 RepID=UPI0010533A10|nr:MULTISPECIES: hypothetical protein [unclassified Neorhizobium]TCV70996.1 hypothetical protein EDE09_107191 [Neorhizobium sp. S3-V5DH]TDX83361.1 hypothetical protein EDE05_10723 [Neorhizobium sp. R1-B]